MLAGYLILRMVDGKWWGVILWVIIAPVLYLLIDHLFLGRARRVAEGNPKRRRAVVPAKGSTPIAESRVTAPPADWNSARDVSTGGEILRRGRRYDRRRA